MYYEFKVTVKGLVPQRNYKPRSKELLELTFTADDDTAASRSTIALLAVDYARNFEVAKFGDSTVVDFISVERKEGDPE